MFFSHRRRQASYQKFALSQQKETGEVVFANGYRFSEDKRSGILLKNEDGAPIARFDHEGNLHIKGEVIKDL